MKETARIQFRGDSEPFETAWNARSSLIIEYGVVAVSKDQPEYRKMHELFAVFSKEHNMTWVEHVDIEYSEQELELFDLLTLHVIGQAGGGDNKLAEVYQRQISCRICGRINYRQVRNLVLDFFQEEVDPLEAGYFQHDICQTDFHEVVVSSKVKTLLDEHLVTRVRLRPVEYVSRDVTISKTYYQLVVEAKIGPLALPSRVQRLDLCENCKEYRQVLLDAWPGTKESEFYFSKSSYKQDWIMETAERFGRVPDFGSKLIINQRLYRLLKEHNITGFRVQPAYLVAES